MDNEDANEKHNERQNQPSVTLDLGGLLKHGKTATQLSLPVLMAIGAAALGGLKDVDAQHTFYFVLFGGFITLVWLIRDRLQDTADAAVHAELHDNLEPKDRLSQVAIMTGLYEIDLVHCPENLDTETLLGTHIVNTRFREALAPSVVQNHHAREMLEGKHIKYRARKVDQVMHKFTGRNVGYRHLAQGLLGDTPFEAAVEAAVLRWLRESVCPAVREAAAEKIPYYQGLLQRRSISKKLRKNVEGWCKKNEQYVEEVDNLLGTDALESKIIPTTAQSKRSVIAAATGMQGDIEIK